MDSREILNNSLILSKYSTVYLRWFDNSLMPRDGDDVNKEAVLQQTSVRWSTGDFFIVVGNAAELVEPRKTPIRIGQANENNHQRTDCGESNDGCQQKDQNARLSRLFNVPVDVGLSNVCPDQTCAEKANSVFPWNKARRDKQDGDTAGRQDDHRGSRRGGNSRMYSHYQHERTQDHSSTNTDLYEGIRK